MLRVYNGEYIEIDGGSRTANGGVGKYGFISKDGTIICDLEYDNAYSFHCGRAFVEKDNKWGCIDTNGELVIPYQYDFAYSFSEDRALVYTGTLKKDGFPDKGVYSFIDLNGNTVFSGMERGFDFSDGFLNEKSTQDLIDKLKTLCSHHEARTLEREVIVANRVKTMNHSIHYNVDGIHRAIADNKQIQFRYFDYDIHKRKRYFKKGEVYVVSPWRLIYTDDNYYLLAYEENAGKFKHFRADKMDSVQALEAERIGKEAFDELDMANYTKYTFSMFGGEPEIVTMVFQNRMMGAVMDRFGSDIVAMKEDNTHFRVSVSVAVSQQFFAWVFGLGKAVRIVAPESVKEQMKKALADIAERYE